MLKYIFSSLILISNLVSASFGEDSLAWPLGVEPAITSSYCEFRPGHFHAGIDIRSYHRVGVPCIAVADGTVTYVRASPGGYGRALFLQLDDGRTAVYAHLQKFSPYIEDIVRKLQEEQQEYDFKLWLDKEQQLRVNKGDTVAFSGQTGTKHPHLHFELRDRNNNLLNPLLEGLTISDNINPTIKSIAITPLNSQSTIRGNHKIKILSDFDLNNVSRPIVVSGKVGIGVMEYDQADNANNYLAGYRLELKLNGITSLLTKFDRFSFEETRQIELERDFGLQRNGKGIFHRLYRVAGNNLDWMEGDGIIDVALNDTIEVEVIVSDVAGNSSSVGLYLIGDTLSDYVNNVPKGNLQIYPNHRTVVYSDDENFKTTIFPSSLYDTMTVSIIADKISNSNGLQMESLFRVEPYDQPLANEVMINIARESFETVEPGWGVYYLDLKEGWTFLGRDAVNGYYTAPALSWETFCLIRDIDFPVVQITSPNDDEIFKSAKPIFHAVVNDSTSGLSGSGLVMKIDGNKVPAEYDPPRNQLIYQPWKPLSGGDHQLELIAEDNAGNITRHIVNFSISQ